MAAGAGTGEDFKQVVHKACAELGIVVGAEQLDKMYEHYCLVMEWNHRCGLTSITGVEEAGIKHYVDSLTCWAVVERGVGCFGDVGSGAGFPGIVLAIQGVGVPVLIEAEQRKADFLCMCLRKLGMKGL
ncbi:MAG: 16S rRNA (guanine(527)-N(7))-methyltransferase RsmG, partial [Bacillota bacterium]